MFARKAVDVIAEWVKPNCLPVEPPATKTCDTQKYGAVFPMENASPLVAMDLAAVADFGQSDFGQTDYWPNKFNRLWPT